MAKNDSHTCSIVVVDMHDSCQRRIRSRGMAFVWKLLMSLHRRHLHGAIGLCQKCFVARDTVGYTVKSERRAPYYSTSPDASLLHQAARRSTISRFFWLSYTRLVAMSSYTRLVAMSTLPYRSKYLGALTPSRYTHFAVSHLAPPP